MCGEEVFFGNDIIERTEALDQSVPRVWMDHNATVGWGILRKLLVYTIPLDPVPDEPVYMRLQIWEPYQRDEFQFGLLKWEKRIHVTKFGTKLEVRPPCICQIYTSFMLYTLIFKYAFD